MEKEYFNFDDAFFVSPSKNNVSDRYVLVTDIPYMSLKKGDICKYDNKNKAAIFSPTSVIYGININDQNFFKPYVEEFFVGTYVKYANSLYTVTGVEYTGSTMNYCIQHVFMPGVKKFVKPGDFTAVKPYWFINSKGELCLTYEGKDISADKWRKVTGNKFNTKEEARKKKDAIR